MDEHDCPPILVLSMIYIYKKEKKNLKDLLLYWKSNGLSFNHTYKPIDNNTLKKFFSMREIKIINYITEAIIKYNTDYLALAIVNVEQLNY